jgi:hypothetical protein
LFEDQQHDGEREGELLGKMGVKWVYYFLCNFIEELRLIYPYCVDEVSLSFLEVYYSDCNCIGLVFQLYSILVILVFDQGDLSIERALFILSVCLFLACRLISVWFYIKVFFLLPALLFTCWGLLSCLDGDLIA